MSSTRLSDFCDDGDEFQDLLDSAEDGAVSGRDHEFIDDILERWESYGLRMYISESQFAYLKRLAKTA